MGKLAGKFLEHCPPAAETRIHSDGKESVDPFMYTGSGGNVFVYYRLYLFYKNHPEYNSDQNECQQFENAAIEALKTHVRIGEAYEEKRGQSSPSFLKSCAGIYTVGALLSKELIDDQNAKLFVEKTSLLRSLLLRRRRPRDPIRCSWVLALSVDPALEFKRL